MKGFGLFLTPRAKIGASRRLGNAPNRCLAFLARLPGSIVNVEPFGVVVFSLSAAPVIKQSVAFVFSRPVQGNGAAAVNGFLQDYSNGIVQSLYLRQLQAIRG
jgi:hypothetical protein